MRKWLALGMAGLVVIAGVGVVLAGYTLSQARVMGAFFDSDGVRIHYTDQGSGDPVILIHGFSVHQDINWRRPGILQALAEDYRVVALDNRGHGLSDKPHDPADYGERMAWDVVRLMNHLDIPRAHVVGYSMGGFITLKLLEIAPERLISAMPCGMAWREATPEATAPILALAADLEAGKGFDVLFGVISPDGDPPGRARMAMVNATLSSFNDKRALAAAMRGFPSLAVSPEALREVRVPVCSVVGDRDPLREGIDRMAELLPDHRVVWVPGGDHITTMADPLLLRAIREFIAGHSGRAGAALDEAA